MSNRRQELYDRVRQSSADRVSYEEMVRLGFWPEDKPYPELPQAEKLRLKEVSAELSGLHKELQVLKDQDKALKQLRKRRMEAARQKRQETRARRAAEKQARAQRWAEAKQRDIIYLGEAVSGGLNQQQSDADCLKSNGLEAIHDAAQLAQAMGLDVGRLRFLAFNRSVSKVNHYVRFSLPKKTGGERVISAPKPYLKEVQHWMLAHILNKVSVHEAAHGFVPGRSIVSNAEPHVGQDVVVNLDLRHFFPTVTCKRVKGMFVSLGYSEQVATILALLASEPEIETVVLDGQTWHVASGERYLPQGAPSSPMITNILCRRLDRRLQGMAQKLGFVYTRYADDLTFSASGEASQEVGSLLKQVHNIVVHEGFVVHPDKTRILRKGSKQEVTGIVVNDKLSVDRKMLRRLRAVLHQMEQSGPEGKRFGHCGDALESAEGYALFVNMVDDEKGKALLEQVRRIRAKYRSERPSYARKGKPKAAEQADEAPEAEAPKKKKPWWKFW